MNLNALLITKVRREYSDYWEVVAQGEDGKYNMHKAKVLRTPEEAARLVSDAYERDNERYDCILRALNNLEFGESLKVSPYVEKIHLNFATGNQNHFYDEWKQGNNKD